MAVSQKNLQLQNSRIWLSFDRLWELNFKLLKKALAVFSPLLAT